MVALMSSRKQKIIKNQDNFIISFFGMQYLGIMLRKFSYSILFFGKSNDLIDHETEDYQLFLK